MNAIYFDMDGTIADLYAFPDWRVALDNEDITPYAAARPMVNMSLLARYLNKLARQGFQLGIISWTSRNGSTEYHKQIEEVKRHWLAKHLPSVRFNEVHIVPYGTPKSSLAALKDGILFDDEKRNRIEWHKAFNGGLAFDETNILEILRGL